MTSETDAARLVAILERLRRRAATAMAVRYMCATTAVALLLAEATMMTAPSIVRPAVLLGGIVLATAIAAFAAWFRAPTIRETALVADRRLHLKDRLGTAYQYRDAADEFSRLVVRDALSHADDLRGASAFPIHVPGWVRFALVAACAAPLVFVIARGVVPELWQRASSGDPSGVGALSIPSPAGSPDGASASPDAVTTTRVPAEARLGAQSPSADDGRPESADPPENTGPSPTRAAGPSESGGTRNIDGAASDSGRTPRAPQTSLTEGVSAGRGSGAAGSPQTTQAGGLTGAPLDFARGRPDGDRGLPGTQPTANPSQDAAYRSAWSTSQRAIAQEHIPSGLRDYVRQYFLAIRPAEPR